MEREDFFKRRWLASACLAKRTGELEPALTGRTLAKPCAPGRWHIRHARTLNVGHRAMKLAMGSAMPGTGHWLRKLDSVVRVNRMKRFSTQGRQMQADEPANSRTVLVVDDEVVVRMLIADELAAAGYRVIEAPDGEAALRLIDRQPIDLLVTDVVMPGDSGVDLAAEMKRVRPDVPVLFISGYSANLLGQDGDLADASVHLLLKPFTSDDLLRSVEAALGRSTASR